MQRNQKRRGDRSISWETFQDQRTSRVNTLPHSETIRVHSRVSRIEAERANPIGITAHPILICCAITQCVVRPYQRLNPAAAGGPAWFDGAGPVSQASETCMQQRLGMMRVASTRQR